MTLDPHVAASRSDSIMVTQSLLPSTLRRPLALAVVLALLSTQPACTLVGAGVGFVIANGEPGPYEQQPLSRSGEPVVSSLQRLHVSPGDTIEVVLLDGARREGKYVRVQPPTASDPETYIVLESSADRDARRRPNGKRLGLEYLPVSEVQSVGVEVVEYGGIAVGAAAGFVLDLILVMLLIDGLQGLSS